MSNSRNAISAEQIARILDALRDGEALVRSGLSEKVNFEVTLFRAVEAGRTRSIDQVIRKITQVIPKDSKKKTNLEVQSPATEILFKEKSEDFKPKDAEDTETKINDPQSDKIKNTEDFVDKPVSAQKSIIEQFPAKEANVPKNVTKDLSQPPLQVIDPEQIKTRMEALPKDVREVVDEKFRGEYF